MKRFTITSLSILCLSLTATTAVRAENRVQHLMKLDTMISAKSMSTEVTPFELVNRAYQGAYRMQGIPGFSSILTDYSSRKITAKDLVKAAIEANQLPAETQNDLDFLRTVDIQLSGRQL
jgi:hypothetical protein